MGSIKSWIICEYLNRVFKFNQYAWLKPYIDMNTELILKKVFLDWLINHYFSEKLLKTIKNMRKHGDTKLVTTERTRNYLVSQPNSHTTKLIGIEMKKNRNNYK